jgi:lipoprotein signal peptidase
MKKFKKMRTVIVCLITLWLADRFLKQLAAFWLFSNDYLIFQTHFNVSWGNNLLEIGLLILLEVLFFLGMIRHFLQNNKLKFLFFGLVALGGFSNLLDWLSWGGVIDFINLFHLAFNLADLMILTGLLGVIFIELKPKTTT